MVTTHCPAVAVPALQPCDPRELAPLVESLARGESADRTFPRGTVIADRLDLCKQSIGPAGAQLVLDALRGHPTIRSVLLGTGAIGDTGAAAIAGALDAGAQLDTIYLGCNRIGPAGVAVLADAIQRRTPHALWLKRNPIGIAGAERMATMIAAGTELRVLDLFNCELDDEGVAIVARALGDPRARVEYIYLGGNAAGWRASRALGEALARTTTLRGLQLAASRFGDDGALALADGLAANRSLEELDLANNAIGPRGGAALARAATRLGRLGLGVVTSARALGEPANQLTDDAAPTLAELVVATSSLRALDLRRNRITSHGATALSRALERNDSLVELSLGRGVARTLLRRIRARLAHNGAPAGPPAHVAAIASVYRAIRR